MLGISLKLSLVSERGVFIYSKNFFPYLIRIVCLPRNRIGIFRRKGKVKEKESKVFRRTVNVGKGEK